MKTLKAILITLLPLLYTSDALTQDIVFTEQEKEFIKNNPIIEFGYEPSWPPYEIYEDGEYNGIVSDYIAIIEKETGLDFQPIPNITWEESLKGLKSGKIKASACVGITDERKEYLNFTKPYLSSAMVIITRKNFKFIGGIEYLKGMSVAVPKSYYTGELLKKDYPDINIEYKDNIYESIKSVSTGESDAFLGNLLVASYYIEHEGFANLKVAAPTEYEKSHIGIAANKDWPEFISICQKVLDKITFEQKNAILQKWVNVRYEHGVNMKLIWKIGIYCLVGMLLIVGAFLFWNETLRKEIKQRNVVEKELANSLKEISAQNDERKNLLNEIHHRIKNNLHMVSGLLKLQALESGSKEVEQHLNEAIERVTSIALVHDKIYKSEDTKNLSLKDFLEMLAEEIISSFSIKKDVKVSITGDLVLKNTNPLPSIAIMMNELLTNSLKYAFLNQESGIIKMEVIEHKDSIDINYSDNGKWKKTSGKEKTFGMTIIEIFTEQMEGNYKLNTENGTSYQFHFPNFYSE